MISIGRDTFRFRATVTAVGVAAVLAVTTERPSGQATSAWTTEFSIEASDMSSRGRNPYFILEPGYALTLEGGGSRLVISVLDETRRVGDVETRVVEERETAGDQLVEVSRNYFAISSRTNSVFYFGEDVDIYKGGKVVSHEGAWLAGANGAKAGLMMPGLPLLRARFYQEIAPGVAMDRAEIMSLSDAFKTPAGTFTNVLRITETTPLDASARDDKYYARGIGLLRDGDMKLVNYSGRD